VSIPARLVDEEFFRDGKMFDGSSIAGWKGINESDMILMPDASTAVIDPFFEETTVDIRCDVIEPTTMQGYERDPRSLAKRAESYLKSTGIADYALFGPENEFFIFDSVRFGNDFTAVSTRSTRSGRLELAHGVPGRQQGSSSRDQGRLLPRAASRCVPGHPFGDVPRLRGDGTQGRGAPSRGRDRRPGRDRHRGRHAGAEGRPGTDPQVRPAERGARLRQDRDLHAKPLVGDNGSGMHVPPVAAEGGQGAVAGDKYGGLSDLALYYIGGIIKHAKALNAFTNAGTNSYKRLVPGFEAPLLLAYSARNRSASIRIPWVSNPKARRIEVRFPDASANPYFAFTAMMMAGLDGIQNKIHPGDPADKDLYDLEPEEAKHIPTVCHSSTWRSSTSTGSGVPHPRRCVHQRRHRRVLGSEAPGGHQVPHVDAPGGAGAVLQLLRP